MAVQWNVNGAQWTQSINTLHQYQQNQIKVIQDYRKANRKSVTIIIGNRSKISVINRRQCYPGLCRKKNVLLTKYPPWSGQSLQFYQLTQISRNVVNFVYIKNMQSYHTQTLNTYWINVLKLYQMPPPKRVFIE